MGTLGSITITGGTGSAAASSSNLQTEFFTVSNPPQTTFTLPSSVAKDSDNDFIIKVYYNGMILEIGQDYTLNGTVLTWTSSINLEAQEKLEVFYQPA